MSSDKKASIFESIVTLDNKSITLEIGENSDGAFLRIVEKGRKTGLIIPVEGINDIKNALVDASKAAVAHGLINKPGSRAPRAAAAAAPAAAAAAAAPKAAREPRAPREPRSAEADTPSNSVYVAGLTWDTTEDQLRNHFKKAGVIVTATILTRKRGKDTVSRGCGIVEFKTVSDANRAIRDLEGTELDGRKISVRADRKAGSSDGAAAAAPAGAAAPAEERKPRERKPRAPIAEENKKLEPTKVFVSNISWDTTPELLSNFAAAIGEVKHCDVLTTRTGRSLGHAVIEFTRASYATEAIQRLNGKELDGRIIGAKEFYAFVETK